MKTFLKIISICLIFLSCSMHKRSSNREEISISDKIQFEIDLVNSFEIMLTVINNSDIPVELRSPKCWGNSIPKMLSESGEEIPSIKVKINPRCFENIILLDSGKKITVPFDFTLNKIYSNLKPGKYFLSFEYQEKIESNVIEVKVW